MRRGISRSGICAVAVAAVTAVAAVVSATASSAAVPVTMTSTAGTTTSVEYRGLRLQVPASWPVVDLSVAPGTCARFDVHAVYVGHPGPQAQCPQGLRGLADALLIEPLDDVSARTTPAPTLRVPAGADLPTSLPATTGHVTTIALEGPGVLVTATYAPDPVAVSRILAAASIDAGATASSAVRSSAVSVVGAASSTEVPGTFNGLGFDACDAPSSTTMDAWLASPYRAVGVYIGGAARACAVQANLTASWVAREVSQGWHLVPLYVGLQAPAQCTSRNFGGNVIDPTQAAAQGGAAADDAADAANQLGMGPGSVITYDIEAYTRRPECTTPVLQFLSAWTTQLHTRGYRSSVYSSVSAAIADLVDTYNAADYARPDQIFLAHWDDVATTTDTVVPNEFWSDHQRAKQYQSAHDETYGGIRINLDTDILDVANSTSPPDTTPPTIGFLTPAAGALLRGTITVTAAAADTSGISRVELLVNGSVVATDAAAPWVLGWASGRANGPVMLGLRTYDRYGNVSLTQRTVTVDNTPPTARITAGPANHARVRGNVTLATAAADTNGIARIELWINHVRIATDGTRPYRFSVRTSRYPHTMTVQLRVVDRAGNLTALNRTWRR